MQGSCGQEKSGFGGPVVRKNSNFEKVRKTGVTGKVRIFVLFAARKWILVKNGLPFIAVLYNLPSK